MAVNKATGARLPLSARPVTVYAVFKDEAPPAAVKVELDEKVYISHFVDCPSASLHRRP